MSKASRTSTASAQHLLESGMALHKAGQFAAAAGLYEQALAQNPKDAQTHYLLGAAYAQSGRLADAVPKLERSLKLRPDFLPGVELIGSIWAQLKAPEKAVPYFRKAAVLAPTSAEVFARLGSALAQCERHDEAAKAFAQALAVDPKNRGTRIAYATVLENLGQTEKAEAILRACVAEDPEPMALITLGTLLGQRERFPEAENVLRDGVARHPTNATLHQLLGHALHKQGRIVEAEAAYRAALALTPDDPKLLERLGENLTDQNRLEDAEAMLNRADQLAPDGPGVLTGLGRILELRGDLNAAIALHTRALALNPNDISARLNRGNARRFDEDFEGALSDYDAALAVNPAVQQINANRALTLLTLGRLAEGWPLFRARIRALHGAPDLTAGKPWDGSPLSGKRVLVWNEYGLGDEILFASLLPELLEIVAHCTVVCQPRLLALFRRSFPKAHIIAMGSPIEGNFDFRMPLIDTAHVLRPSLTAFPKHTGYLCVDTELREKLRARYLDGTTKTLVGISWHSQSGATGRFKSSDLLQWREILSLPNARFVSLQYGNTADDIARAREQFGCEIVVDPEINPSGDFDPFAAQVAAMDAVISVSNTAAHVAGALGKPVFTLLPTGPGALWCWFRDRSDSPWYPSARLFRRGRDGAWQGVVNDVARAVHTWRTT